MKYILIISILFILSCSKQEVKPVEPVQIRTGGLIADDPKKVAIVPLIVSKGLIAQRGKPVKNAPVFISPINGAVVSGIVNISVTGSIYINGVLVGINSYSWNTNGLSSGAYTITAVSKGVSTSITVFINTIIVEPPQSSGVILWTPPMGNQGSEGSCVAFAVSNARSIEWFYKTGNKLSFSPEHLFNNVKFGETCTIGTAMQTALEFIMLNGILPISEMPYTSGTCQPTETELQKQIALNYKIEGFYKIYTTDRQAIKSMIDQNKPVVISIIVDNEFINAKAGFVWKSYSGNGSLGHSVTICGYDDTKNAYYIMNSWGNWADGGFGWIDYDLFPQRTGTYCYSIK
jgi:hypothetical protein